MNARTQDNSVVDDGDDSAERPAALLEQRGHRVWLAHDGARSLDWAVPFGALLGARTYARSELPG